MRTPEAERRVLAADLERISGSLLNAFELAGGDPTDPVCNSIQGARSYVARARMRLDAVRTPA